MHIDLSKSKTHWPLRNKLKRALWVFCLEPLVRWLPKFCAPLRVAALRAMGAHIGRACMIARGVRVLMPWNLTLGDCAVIGESVNIYNYAPVTVGTQSMVSQFCYLCTGSHDHGRVDMPLTFAPITIGDQAWVAAGVFVAPGVAIADGAVVGAMSVVTRSLEEPWTVYAGNPCKRIKARPVPGPAPEGAHSAQAGA